MRFSANLGFLWADLPLPHAIRAAKAAGFHAVECHWPYDTAVDLVTTALAETGLPMLGLNTVRGQPGDMGLLALPGREAEARAAIDQAADWADAIGAAHIHVMAGTASGPEACETYLANLRYAHDRTGKTIVIEPLNAHDAPGYFLTNTDQARAIIANLGLPRLKLMFDCYHVGRTEGDVIARLEALLPMVGHIQFASVPDRGPPDSATLETLVAIQKLGWTSPLGAEYRPPGQTEATLGWMQEF